MQFNNQLIVIPGNHLINTGMKEAKITKDTIQINWIVYPKE